MKVLTGESLAVEKSMDTILEEAPLGDRTNMLFSGSFVTYGRGRAVVTNVGMQTEVGKIAGLLKSTSENRRHFRRIWMILERSFLF